MSTPKTRVLVVDDDLRLRDLLRRYLSEQDFSVHVAQDAAAMDKLLARERFDLIVLDLTDPDTPAHRLYTREFFAMARSALAPGGAISLHLGSPVYQPERVRAMLADLHAVFPIVRPLGLYIPLYGAYWGLAVVSESLDPCALSAASAAERLAARRIEALELYNPEMHGALFALPNFYRRLLPPA